MEEGEKVEEGDKVDGVERWKGGKVDQYTQEKTAEKQPNLFEAPSVKASALELRKAHTQTFDNQSDAPACDTCGSMMVRNAACYKCLNCGSTSGCS